MRCAPSTPASASSDAPTVLPVVGDVVAGATSRGGMGPGLAMRIMTGAPMPAGADAVIPLELTDRGVARVAISAPVHTGECVRRAGEDLAARCARARRRRGARAAADRAAGGDRPRPGVVRPRPRVMAISTGSELIEVGAGPSFGEVTDSNSYLISAAARDAGADVRRLGIVPDDHSALLDMLESQLLRADMLSPPVA